MKKIRSDKGDNAIKIRERLFNFAKKEGVYTSKMYRMEGNELYRTINFVLNARSVTGKCYYNIEEMVREANTITRVKQPDGKVVNSFLEEFKDLILDESYTSLLQLDSITISLFHSNVINDANLDIFIKSYVAYLSNINILDEDMKKHTMSIEGLERIVVKSDLVYKVFNPLLIPLIAREAAKKRPIDDLDYIRRAIYTLGYLNKDAARMEYIMNIGNDIFTNLYNEEIDVNIKNRMNMVGHALLNQLDMDGNIETRIDYILSLLDVGLEFVSDVEIPLDSTVMVGFISSYRKVKLNG